MAGRRSALYSRNHDFERGRGGQEGALQICSLACCMLNFAGRHSSAMLSRRHYPLGSWRAPSTQTSTKNAVKTGGDEIQLTATVRLDIKVDIKKDHNKRICRCECEFLEPVPIQMLSIGNENGKRVRDFEIHFSVNYIPAHAHELHETYGDPRHRTRTNFQCIHCLMF